LASEHRNFPTRVDRWRRTPAIVVLVALAALMIAAAWPVAAAPEPRVRASTADQTDLDLYRAVICRVGAGENYYPVAADELRKGGYPLRPFITFRLPTLTFLYAQVPAIGMLAAEGLLALAVLVIWCRRLASGLRLLPLALAMVLLVGGTAGLVDPVTGLFHESWAALLLALMIGLRRPGHAAGAIFVGGLALAIRETALPMILVMGGLAVAERRSKEALGWAAVLGLFALALIAHAAMVASVVLPGDPASPGWSGMLGPRFTLAAFTSVSAATALPNPLAAMVLVLSLFGWVSVATGWALRVSLLLLGYGAMLALFARPDTFYWALLVAPLSLVGLAFVPRAIAALVSAARGMAQPSS
jgi:hypothetical protein